MAKYYGTEKVGGTFEYNGKKYRVVESRGEYICLGCVFDEGTVGCSEMACAPYLRGDRKAVNYEEVK